VQLPPHGTQETKKRRERGEGVCGGKRNRSGPPQIRTRGNGGTLARSDFLKVKGKQNSGGVREGRSEKGRRIRGKGERIQEGRRGAPVPAELGNRQQSLPPSGFSNIHKQKSKERHLSSIGVWGSSSWLVTKPNPSSDRGELLMKKRETGQRSVGKKVLHLILTGGDPREGGSNRGPAAGKKGGCGRTTCLLLKGENLLASNREKNGQDKLPHTGRDQSSRGGTRNFL